MEIGYRKQINTYEKKSAIPGYVVAACIACGQWGERADICFIPLCYSRLYSICLFRLRLALRGLGCHR